MISHNQVLAMIAEAMSSNSREEQDSDSSTHRYIVIHDGFKAETVQSYELNRDSIEVIDSISEDRDNSGDWGHERYVVVSFDKGLALVSDVYSSDYTYSNQEHRIDIMETDSWENFDKTILTDELRNKFINFAVEKEMLRNKEFGDG